jgi:hypothetical protein|eukprot:COSAG02_NODE_4711_length_5071_cov_293.065567_7_plen_73_part_00
MVNQVVSQHRPNTIEALILLCEQLRVAAPPRISHTSSKCDLSAPALLWQRNGKMEAKDAKGAAKDARALKIR